MKVLYEGLVALRPCHCLLVVDLPAVISRKTYDYPVGTMDRSSQAQAGAYQADPRNYADASAITRGGCIIRAACTSFCTRMCVALKVLRSRLLVTVLRTQWYDSARFSMHQQNRQVINHVARRSKHLEVRVSDMLLSDVCID